MRLAMAVLADAANMRENTMSVLSAGINQVWRPEYPTSLGLTVALMLECAPEDDADPVRVQVEVRHADSEPEDAPVIGLRAEVGLTSPRDDVAYVPMPLDFRNRQIPAPGKYQVVIRVADLEPVTLGFVANLFTPDGSGPSDGPGTAEELAHGSLD